MASQCFRRDRNRHRGCLIERASYGVLGDPRRTRDVREKVQQKVDGGQYSFPVGLMAEGDDPAPEKVKTLVVEYRH